MFLRNFARFNLAACRNSFAVGRRAVADYNELCFLAGEVMCEHGCYSFSMRPGHCGQAARPLARAKGRGWGQKFQGRALRSLATLRASALPLTAIRWPSGRFVSLITTNLLFLLAK